ncbi:MAG: hypothetical protein ACFBWO_01510 [Paracoccaceae bacterium]
MANERNREIDPWLGQRVQRQLRHYRVLVHSTLLAASAAGVAVAGLAVVL